MMKKIELKNLQKNFTKNLFKNIKINLKEKDKKDMSIKRERSTIIHYNYNIIKNPIETEAKNVRKKRLKSSDVLKYKTEENLKLPLIKSSLK